MRFNKKEIIKTALFFSLIIIISACGGKEEKKEEKSVKVVSVEVQKLVNEQYTDYIPVVGVVKADLDAQITYSEGSAGVIESFEADKGDWVNKGDVIFTIENSVIKAGADAAEAQYKLSQTNFEKQEKIYNDNASSEFEYLRSKYERDQAKANYELNKARYDKTIVKAPFSGYVNNKYFEIGELVTPGAPVVTLVNTNKIKVEAGVPERFVGQVKVGDTVFCSFDELISGTVTGRISFVSSSVDPNNRTFEIEAVISNKEGNLKPELLVDVQIQNGIYDNIITIPADVITRSDSSYIAYVAEDSVAIGRKLNIVSRSENSVAIDKGLKSGDLLVVVGHQNLVHGQRINIVK